MDLTENLQRLLDRAAVVETVVGIANTFDRKDWPRLRSYLADELYTDYSQFRGEPPSYVSADAYVAARETGLRGVTSLHLTTNHEVAIDRDTATCYSAYRIYRVDSANPARRLDTAGTYDHRLSRADSRWLVTSITQTVVVLEGDRSIHGAFRDSAGDAGRAT